MVLKELMRHASLSTTEKYYVGQNAQQTAQLLASLMLPAMNSGAEKAVATSKGDT
jgi:hypothetical protein